MEKHSIDQLLNSVYTRFPEAEQRPVIGITANYENIDATLRSPYYNQVIAAGGVPVIIPPVNDAEIIINTLDRIDGLLLSGGADVNPLWSNEEPSPALKNINSQRDAAELLTIRLAYNRQLPIFGICRGIQTIATALGGHVCQDINPTIVKHSQDADRTETTHSVRIEKDSLLSQIFSKYGNHDDETLYVNSFHHQAVDNPGNLLRAVAYAADGTIEAVESAEHKSIVGVQWHPEWLECAGLPLFKWLVERAAEYRKAVNIHQKILTLDSHCDTPMFFPQGINFLNRDKQILVDLHKMTDGRQDATFMVAYIPQRMAEEKGEMGPFAYANSIFDEIENIVARSNKAIKIARNANDLYTNKLQGRKSIVLGIENGLAIEGNLGNLEHFAKRGIAYMTLCHNGDNDICDSARGNHTHNGVSPFGVQVIEEMNRLGIMVDLSHAAEKSFYDALAISKTPIVCSHSNCRALCDHPRNLTDEQLQALAKCGGVAQITFYPGFLETAGEADITHAVQHLEHAIDIMGIDHVGIGTDFDGDGGVPGMRDSSEIMQFTMQLLRRKYALQDIEKIWGGNWLRIMNIVQNSKK